MKAGKFPKRIEIELSNTCNLSCTYCPRRYLGDLRGFMDFGLFKKIIDEASAWPQTVIVLHRRGESLLHPDFVKICGYIQGKFREIQLATNATVLDASKSRAIIDALQFISFSIDVPERFDTTRVPARYAQVEKNIIDFLALNNGKIRTQVSMVRTAQTLPAELELFKELWKDKVSRVRIYEEHSIGGVFGSVRNPRCGRVPCVMPAYEMLVYQDGKVGRCNHDWNGEEMGDLTRSTVAEVWNNREYRGLRQQQETLVFTDKVCAGCNSWYGEIGNQGTGEVLEK